MSLFNYQSLLTITLDCGTDVTAASVALILYTRPDGVSASWVATVSGNSLIYIVQPNDISQQGNWDFQAYVEIGGKKNYGEIVTKTFIEPLLDVLTP